MEFNVLHGWRESPDGKRADLVNGYDGRTIATVRWRADDTYTFVVPTENYSEGDFCDMMAAQQECEAWFKENVPGFKMGAALLDANAANVSAESLTAAITALHEEVRALREDRRIYGIRVVNPDDGKRWWLENPSGELVSGPRCLMAETLRQMMEQNPWDGGTVEPFPD